MCRTIYHSPFAFLFNTLMFRIIFRTPWAKRTLMEFFFYARPEGWSSSNQKFESKFHAALQQWQNSWRSFLIPMLFFNLKWRRNSRETKFEVCWGVAFSLMGLLSAANQNNRIFKVTDMVLPLSCFYMTLFFRLSIRLSLGVLQARNDNFVKKWLSAIEEWIARPAPLASYLRLRKPLFF